MWARLIFACACALVGLAVVQGANAFAAGPLLDPSGCINQHPTAAYVSLHAARGAHARDPYEVLARERDLPYARRLLTQLRRYPVWAFDRSVFDSGTGHSVVTLAPPAPHRYFQIYVVDGAALTHLEADGLDARYCAASGSDAALVATGARAAVAIHEVFHAFQDAAGNHPLPGSWWGEATAEWGSLYAGVEDSNAFLDHPELPLALFEQTGPNAEHQYAVFRFVQWLAHHADRDVFTRILAWPFVQLGADPSADALSLVERSEAREHRSLARDLGEFWADHLSDDGELGPAAASDTMTAIIGPASQHAAVDDYAAKLIKLDIDPGAVSVRVVIRFTRGELWVAKGAGEPTLEPSTFDKTYCTNGEGTPWPGTLGIAFTAHRFGGTLDVNTTASSDPDSCPTPPRHPPVTAHPGTTIPVGPGGTCGIAGFYGMGSIQTPPVYVSATVTCLGGPHIIAVDVTAWCSADATIPQTTGTQPQPVNIPLNPGGAATWDVTSGGTTFEVTFAVTFAYMTGTVAMLDGPCEHEFPFVAPRE